MGERRTGHRVFMLAFIASPLVVLAILVYAMSVAMERGPSMVAEPVGAGAGATGGANALGQALFGPAEERSTVPAEQAPRGVVLVVRDQTGLAGPDRPLYLTTSRSGWEVRQDLRLRPRGDGAWEIRLPPHDPEATEPLTFRFVLGPGAAAEVDDAGEPVGARRLPRVSPAEAAGEEPLVYEFTVRAFAGH